MYFGKKALEDCLYDCHIEIRLLTIFAHNFASFDSFFILQKVEELEDVFFIQKLFVKDNTVIYLELSYGMRTMIFKDTMLLYNTPLNEIGENYG